MRILHAKLSKFLLAYNKVQLYTFAHSAETSTQNNYNECNFTPFIFIL